VTSARRTCRGARMGASGGGRRRSHGCTGSRNAGPAGGLREFLAGDCGCGDRMQVMLCRLTAPRRSSNPLVM
jgi:hypothetical protein